MSEWKAVYRSRRRTPESEAFACTSCGAQWDGPHSAGPPNGVCRCSKCTGKTPSQAYKEGWERIWGKRD